MQIAVKTKLVKIRSKSKRKLTCYDCIHSSRFTSDFSYELPAGYVYCRKWEIITTCGAIKSCSLFERFERGKWKEGKERRRCVEKERRGRRRSYGG